MAEPSADHILIVTRENEDVSFDTRCLGVTDRCRAWVECREPDCDPAEEDEPHGVVHQWVEDIGYGVAVEPPVCWLPTWDYLCDVATDMRPADAWAAGEYPITVGWDTYGYRCWRRTLGCGRGLRSWRQSGAHCPLPAAHEVYADPGTKGGWSIP